MNAEKQYKRVFSNVVLPVRNVERVSFVDNRSDSVTQAKLITFIQKKGSNIKQRKIDYGNEVSNLNSEMSIPGGCKLYHATKDSNNVYSILDNGVDVRRSLSTQLGKGFYTTWFQYADNKYGSFVLRYTVTQKMNGQQVYSHSIKDANAKEMRDNQNYKEVWDVQNDFLYTPELDITIDGQDIPHQVKITESGVSKIQLESILVDKDVYTIEQFREKYKPRPKIDLSAIKRRR